MNQASFEEFVMQYFHNWAVFSMFGLTKIVQQWLPLIILSGGVSQLNTSLALASVQTYCSIFGN